MTYGFKLLNNKSWVVVDDTSSVLSVKEEGLTRNIVYGYNIVAAKARNAGISVADKTGIPGGSTSNRTWSHYYSDYDGWIRGVNDFVVPKYLYSQNSFGTIDNGRGLAFAQLIQSDPDYYYETLTTNPTGGSSKSLLIYKPGANIRKGDLVFYDVSDRRSLGQSWGFTRSIVSHANNIKIQADWNNNNNTELQSSGVGYGTYTSCYTYPYTIGINMTCPPIPYIIASGDITLAGSETMGMVVRDSVGEVIFDSRCKLLPVLDYYKVTSAQMQSMFTNASFSVVFKLSKSLTNGCYVCAPFMNGYSLVSNKMIHPWVRQTAPDEITVSAYHPNGIGGTLNREFTQDVLLIVARPPT